MDYSQIIWPKSALAAGMVACLFAFFLVLTKKIHGRYSGDSVFGVQRNHRGLIPRIGGMTIVAGVAAGMAFSAGPARTMLEVVLLSGVPAFVFGLLEDLTKRVSVRTRLLATMGSGALGWLISGAAVTHVNVPGLDTLLLFTPVAVLFTAIAIGGMANSMNIIDGFNGLAAGTTIIILLAMGVLSLHLGDTELSTVCRTLAAAALGFMLINWPFGRLFLGDGGAYFLGFGIGWSSVLLLQRHPEVSGWCPLTICAYPVLEVLFSMVRRKMHRRGLGQPDHLHLHSLVKRRLVRRLFPHMSHLMRNSATGAVMWGVAAPPALWGALFYDNTPMLILGIVLFAMGYATLYARLVRFQWCLPWVNHHQSAPAA